jgi:hypothetical protein
MLEDSRQELSYQHEKELEWCAQSTLSEPASNMPLPSEGDADHDPAAHEDGRIQTKERQSKAILVAPMVLFFASYALIILILFFALSPAPFLEHERINAVVGPARDSHEKGFATDAAARASGTGSALALAEPTEPLARVRARLLSLLTRMSPLAGLWPGAGRRGSGLH